MGKTEAVLTSTHSICCWAKIIKIKYAPLFLVLGGIFQEVHYMSLLTWWNQYSWVFWCKNDCKNNLQHFKSVKSKFAWNLNPCKPQYIYIFFWIMCKSEDCVSHDPKDTMPPGVSSIIIRCSAHTLNSIVFSLEV